MKTFFPRPLLRSRSLALLALAVAAAGVATPASAEIYRRTVVRPSPAPVVVVETPRTVQRHVVVTPRHDSWQRHYRHYDSSWVGWGPSWGWGVRHTWGDRRHRTTVIVGAPYPYPYGYGYGYYGRGWGYQRPVVYAPRREVVVVPSSARYETVRVAERPNYAATGAVLGAIAGAIIGHNDDRHGWEGAAYGAGAGLLLGAIAENNVRSREVAVARADAQQASVEALRREGYAVWGPTMTPPQTGATATAGGSANSLYGR